MINLKRCKIFKETQNEYQPKMPFQNKISRRKSAKRIKMQKKSAK